MKVRHFIQVRMSRVVDVPDAIWEAAQAEINGNPYVSGPGQDALDEWMTANGVRLNMEDVDEVDDESVDAVS
jgi:hypothetical protein